MTEPATSPPESSTRSSLAPPRDRARRERVGQFGRTAVIAALSVFVALGALGVFGYRDGRVAAEGEGFRVAVDHPRITRGGLPATWGLTVVRLDGEPIEGSIRIEMTTAYLDVFDRNFLSPEPDSTWQTERATTWVYSPDGDEELRVNLDMRAQPGARWRHGATTAVHVGGRPVAVLEYSTLVFP